MKTKGHHPWESAECAKFENHHALGTRARLAYELLLQAGQSRSMLCAWADSISEVG